jgi:murein L,D-transpeptidase YcbB/YkuD
MQSRALGFLMFVLVLAPACAQKVDNAVHADGMRALVEGTPPPWVERGALGRRLWKIEREFYASREYLPAWVDGDGATPQWKDLVQQLKYSERHGLEPASYGVAEFEALREASQDRMRGTVFPLDQIPEHDASMTYAYLRYAAGLLGWTRSGKQVHPTWLTSPKKEDLAARLTAAVANNTVRATLEELAPTHPQYKGLQTALARELAAPTGHAEQIRMNLERWRWAPHDLGDRYVLVNVPSYQLQVIEGEQPVLAMRVIVGLPSNQTPLFSDEMTYVVFSPYWHIPSGILRNETLPRVTGDPDYLRRNNIEVVGTSGVVDPGTIDWSDEGATEGLSFRQKPGADNALGLVKFIFPNHFDVYLHDTPGDHLFEKEQRALSHGCIRVEDPVALAEYVMRDNEQWDPPRIKASMHSRQEQAVTLKRKLPVHIGYWTAWVEPDGQTVTYTDDPYGIDPKHARLRERARASSSPIEAPRADPAAAGR